jgi:hypothetical protein
MMKNRRAPLPQPPPPYWLDVLAAAAVVAFGITIVLKPLPNYDIWWMLAVGRRIVETGAYIYRDPFTFTVAGTPWSPQSYASAILFYALFKAGGMGALAVLRALLVGAMTALTFRTLRRIGVSLAVAAPLVVVMLANSHTRFTDRGQLFEYVFVAWLVGFLLTSHERRGRSFYILPVAVQLAWVQFHSSFLLGPALAGLFFGAEWIAAHTNASLALHRRDWKRAWTLVLLMALACVANPNPKAFLVQPFDPAQRALITRFTLEWKSPFDPAIAIGNFHPYYEVLLTLAALAVLVRLRKLPLAPVALMAATAYLSLKSHRFRVEFALVAVPMIALLLRDVRLAGRKRFPRAMWAAIGLVAAVAIMGIEHDRILVSHDVPALYPDAAFSFIVRNDVAKRPFHPVGFGSYMMWDLYGKRRTFIDGRNFDLQLHRDFIATQASEAGFRAIIRKYGLDAFILPPPGHSNQGMQNIHRWLTESSADWRLVYADDRAFVYIAR